MASFYLAIVKFLLNGAFSQKPINIAGFLLAQTRIVIKKKVKKGGG
jgi:hypothetical protein